MMVASLLLASALTGLHGIGDWIVGCDNGWRCGAAAYADMRSEHWTTLTMVREPGGSALPSISLASDTPIADVSVDGRPLGLRLRQVEGGKWYDVAPGDSLRFAWALRDARQARTVGPDRRERGPLLVGGAAAAMLLIDERQGRIGTRGALARPGSRSDATVPAPRPLPVVQAVRGSRRTPAAVDHRTLTRLVATDDCEDRKGVKSDAIEQHRLDTRHSLLSITFLCRSGPYNVVSAHYVVSDGGTLVRARFDVEPFAQDDGQPTRLYYNSGWEPAERRFFSSFKGRGYGDCGSSRTYAWDGTRFRLVEAAAMNDCRNVTDFITTFRRRVVVR